MPLNKATKPNLAKIFVLWLFKMVANQRTPDLNRGLSSNFWLLTSANYVEFTEECVMCMCNIPMIRICEIDIMFINIHKNLKTRNWFRYEILFTFLSLKVFRHEERETQSFYADCFYLVSSQLNQRAVLIAHKFVWPRPALNFDSLVRRQELTSLTFSQIPSPRFQCVTSLTSPGLNSYLEWHILSARAWTPALMLHLTNLCTKQKVLLLTKPKGKIYKMRSLRNYITYGEAGFSQNFTNGLNCLKKV